MSFQQHGWGNHAVRAWRRRGERGQGDPQVRPRRSEKLASSLTQPREAAMRTTGDASGRVRVDKKEFYGRLGWRLDADRWYAEYMVAEQAGTERPA